MNKLGSFELHGVSNTFGNQTQFGDGHFGQDGSEYAAGGSPSEIMGGIAAILTPLIQAGVGIYAANQQAEMAKNQVHPVPERRELSYPNPTPKKSPVLIILLGLVVLAVVGGMIFMMQKGGAGAPGYGPPPPGYGPPPPAVPFAYQAPPAAPPAPLRRVKRRKKRKRRKPE